MYINCRMSSHQHHMLGFARRQPATGRTSPNRRTRLTYTVQYMLRCFFSEAFTGIFSWRIIYFEVEPQTHAHTHRTRLCMHASWRCARLVVTDAAAKRARAWRVLFYTEQAEQTRVRMQTRCLTWEYIWCGVGVLLFHVRRAEHGENLSVSFKAVADMRSTGWTHTHTPKHTRTTNSRRMCQSREKSHIYNMCTWVHIKRIIARAYE